MSYLEREIVLEGVDQFIRERDQWIKAGVLTKEEITNSVSVKQKAIQNIEMELRFHGLNRFKAIREKWVNTGVVSQAETDQILKNYEKR